jgi:tRNA(fMet)-specific endonuclease VapC
LDGVESSYYGAWMGVSKNCPNYCNLTDEDRRLFAEFLERVERVDLSSHNAPLLEIVLQIRQVHRLKLPDAIIAASAIQNNAMLVTEDADFNKVTELRVVSIAEIV